MVSSLPYYYLTGGPANVEEWLMKPSRLAEKWRVDAWYSTYHLPRYEKGVKFIAGYLLLFASLPLQGIAQAVHFLFREKIKLEEWEKQKKYWDQIIFSEGSDYKRELIAELIKSRIISTVYARIAFSPRAEERYLNLLSQDGVLACEQQPITEQLSQGKRCLCFLLVSRNIKWATASSRAYYKAATTLNHIPRPDSKSNYFKRAIRALPEKCDCLVLTAKTAGVSVDSLEDPRLRRRLQEVLSPFQQTN
jgi:hypothetical protein